ncbi:MAG: hypothetical protein QG640_66 [Patescibacteria group bacterium]|nr:hypothetical protein [Patescibacteria group bacterium]
MLLLVTASYKITGIIADEEMVCCGNKIRAPKFFSDYDEASAFVNQVIDGPNWHTFRILPTVPDILEMLEGVDMPISILEDAIRESDAAKMAMNWELLRQ